MIKFKILFLPLLFFLLFFTKNVFAGGGNVWIVVDGNGITNNVGQNIRVVRVYISPELPCKGAEITFKYAEPKEGDFINVGSFEQPYIMQGDRQPYFKNGLMGTTCSTYAKVGSKFFGDREFYATVKTSDGRVTDSQKLVLRMDGKSYDTPEPEDPYWDLTVAENNPPLVPNTLPESKLDVRLLNQSYISRDLQEITIKFGWKDGWSQDIDFDIYKKIVNEKDWQRVITATKGPSANFGLTASENSKVKVVGCIAGTNICTDSNELLIHKYQEEKIAYPTPSIRPDVSNLPTPLVIDATQKLQQRIDSLQNQLNETQKRQGVLEKAFNDLLNRIKTLFPFFKQ